MDRAGGLEVVMAWGIQYDLFVNLTLKFGTRIILIITFFLSYVFVVVVVITHKGNEEN